MRQLARLSVPTLTMKRHKLMRLSALLLLVAWLLPASGFAAGEVSYLQTMDRDDGLVEVGGPHAGVEFHRSRPLPSRISFYYPVANSIDLSTDYWTRWESIPMRVLVSAGGVTDTLDRLPMVVASAPHTAVFSGEAAGLPVRVRWRFGESLPITLLEIEVGKSEVAVDEETEIKFSLWPLLRTCQSWEWTPSDSPVYGENGATAWAASPHVNTDSAAVFVVNLGKMPAKWGAEAAFETAELTDDAPAGAGDPFTFVWSGSDAMSLRLAIGSCRIDEVEELIGKTANGWQSDVEAYEDRIAGSTRLGNWEGLPEDGIEESLFWSWDMMQANRHSLEGRLMPMPCPAQYNFYFTHDALQTGLGTTIADPEVVAGDLRDLLEITRKDSILPHAYYWRDGEYQTEFCNEGNWNHLWFLLTSAAWLRHSGDVELAGELMPVLQKSLQMILTNLGEDGLMHAGHPDWWDIGNVPGRRSFLTALAVRAIEEYAEFARKAGYEETIPENLYEIRDGLVEGLREELWSDEFGFLMNTIGEEWDEHYYAGSLVAGMYGLLEPEQQAKLIETTQIELLDPEIGIRMVAPADFHLLIDEYNFHGMEMGEPYAYINGGVWSQGNALYILSLLQGGDVEGAYSALWSYLTVVGVASSPGGQPSLYEYRFSGLGTPEYGRVDKPTFLWAGGWLINCLYQVSGLRENAAGIYLEAMAPEELANVAFDFKVSGETCRVERRGQGESFARILVDGEESASAVVIGTPESIVVEAGAPTAPYLASSTAAVTGASVKGRKRDRMTVDLAGLTNQPWSTVVVSPSPVKKASMKGAAEVSISSEPLTSGEGYRTVLSGVLPSAEGQLLVRFEKRR